MSRIQQETIQQLMLVGWTFTRTLTPVLIKLNCPSICNFALLRGLNSSAIFLQHTVSSMMTFNDKHMSDCEFVWHIHSESFSMPSVGWVMLPVPDYGIGIVGNCLGPTMSRGPMKDGCKIFSAYVNQSVTNLLCIVSANLWIFLY